MESYKIRDRHSEESNEYYYANVDYFLNVVEHALVWGLSKVEIELPKKHLQSHAVTETAKKLRGDIYYLCDGFGLRAIVSYCKKGLSIIFC